MTTINPLGTSEGENVKLKVMIGVSAERNKSNC